MRTEDLPPVLTVQEAAALLRLKRSTAYELVRRGQIPSFRVGRFIRVPRDALLRMVVEADGAHPAGGCRAEAAPPPPARRRAGTVPPPGGRSRGAGGGRGAACQGEGGRPGAGGRRAR